MIRLSADRTRQLVWIAFAIYLAGLGISAVLRQQGDFNVYYRTGHRVLRRVAIYPANDSDRFLYAPIFAIGFAPFAMLPRRMAQAVWFLINGAGLIAFVLGARTMLFGRIRELSPITIAIPIVLAARFIGNNIEHGQINLVVLALCVWAVVDAREARPMRSGLMLAIAVLIKPFAILVAWYLLLRRKWPCLLWASAAIVVLFVLPILVFGISGALEQTSDYLRSVASMTDRYREMLTNQSAVSAIARLFIRLEGEPRSSALPFWIGMGLEMLLIGAVSISAMRGFESDDEIAADRLPLAGTFCLIPGFAPISWKSYFAALLVPYMALVETIRSRYMTSAGFPRISFTLLAVALLLNFVPGRHLNRVALFYSFHFVSSILTLAALAALPHDDDGIERPAPVTISTRVEPLNETAGADRVES